MKDSHVHTNISHDGKSSMREYMEVASSKGIDEITFTEHFDIYDGVQTNIQTLDVEQYRQEYLRNKDDSIVKTNYGIEVGLRPESYSKIKGMLSKNDFDFVIGSSHITCGKDISKDSSFFRKLNRKEAYNKYFEEVIKNIQMYANDFDVYGHLDYIVRYGNYLGKVITLEEFKDSLDRVLLSLINRRKGIEVNTSGLRYGLPNPHPNMEIVKRYRELGGRIITLGSDAHEASELGSYFDETLDMIEAAGFDQIAVYHEREPEFIKVKSLRKK